MPLCILQDILTQEVLHGATVHDVPIAFLQPDIPHILADNALVVHHTKPLHMHAREYHPDVSLRELLCPSHIDQALLIDSHVQAKIFLNNAAVLSERDMWLRGLQPPQSPLAYMQIDSKGGWLAHRNPKPLSPTRGLAPQPPSGAPAALGPSQADLQAFATNSGGVRCSSKSPRSRSPGKSFSFNKPDAQAQAFSSPTGGCSGSAEMAQARPPYLTALLTPRSPAIAALKLPSTSELPFAATMSDTLTVTGSPPHLDSTPTVRVQHAGTELGAAGAQMNLGHWSGAR